MVRATKLAECVISAIWAVAICIVDLVVGVVAAYTLWFTVVLPIHVSDYRRNIPFIEIEWWLDWSESVCDVVSFALAIWFWLATWLLLTFAGLCAGIITYVIVKITSSVVAAFCAAWYNIKLSVEVFVIVWRGRIDSWIETLSTTPTFKIAPIAEWWYQRCRGGDLCTMPLRWICYIMDYLTHYYLAIMLPISVLVVMWWAWIWVLRVFMSTIAAFFLALVHGLTADFHEPFVVILQVILWFYGVFVDIFEAISPGCDIDAGTVLRHALNALLETNTEYVHVDWWEWVDASGSSGFAELTSSGAVSSHGECVEACVGRVDGCVVGDVVPTNGFAHAEGCGVSSSPLTTCAGDCASAADHTASHGNDQVGREATHTHDAVPAERDTPQDFFFPTWEDYKNNLWEDYKKNSLSPDERKFFDDIDAERARLDVGDTPVDAERARLDVGDTHLDATRAPLDVGDTHFDATRAPLDVGDTLHDATNTPIDPTQPSDAGSVGPTGASLPSDHCDTGQPQHGELGSVDSHSHDDDVPTTPPTTPDKGGKAGEV